MNSSTSRRQFLKAAGLGAAPLILPSHVWAVDSAPGSKITMGFIGVGMQGGGLLGGFLGQAGVQVLAVCDVDTNRRNSAKERVVKHYADNKADGWNGCEAYNDYRELLARKDIDAVCIATPDHWHAIITVAALKAGKDVYCEKPLPQRAGSPDGHRYCQNHGSCAPDGFHAAFQWGIPRRRRTYSKWHHWQN